MIKSLRKKGFTIVELVIVIAVIAILAAVLIPTFTGIIKKANISADTQLVRNLNTALAEDKAINGEHKTMQSALDAAVEGGYIVARINAKATGNEILWDSVADAFCYLNDGKVEYTPDVTGKKAKDNEKYKLWKIDSVPSDVFSTYLYNIGGKTEFNDVKTGIDVGNETVTSISYVGNDSAQDVVIRTNNSDLTINAPQDTVAHYNTGITLFIASIKPDSYHEYGVMNTATIKYGRIVVEKEGYIGEITSENNSNVVVDGIVKKVTGVLASGSGFVEDNNSAGSLGTKPAADLLIYSEYDFNEFRNAVNGGNNYSGKLVRLMRNIDLTYTNWTPIGQLTTSGDTSDSSFNGTFDGGNYTISYKMPISEMDYAGLFKFVRNGVIKNLNVVVDVEASRSIWFGGIAGRLDNSIIENCHVSGKVTVTETNSTDGCSVAGLVEYLNMSTIKNSSSNVEINITATSDDAYVYAGGIAGEVNCSTIDNCINNGEINASAGSYYDYDETYEVYSYVYSYVGGIAAYTKFGSEISNCTNNGNITSGRSESSYATAGGIAGSIGVSNSNISTHTNSIISCKNTGIVDCETSNQEQEYLGGIVGEVYGWKDYPGWEGEDQLAVINDCSSTTTPTSSSGCAGNIFGWNSIYNKGDNKHFTIDGVVQGETQSQS